MNINLNLFMKKNFNRHLKNMNHQTRRTRNPRTWNNYNFYDNRFIKSRGLYHMKKPAK